jgi:hypothetical protein
MGCQWKILPIERNAKGLPEIHYTRIYRAMRRWQANGFIDKIFAGSRASFIRANCSTSRSFRPLFL